MQMIKLGSMVKSSEEYEKCFREQFNGIVEKLYILSGNKCAEVVTGSGEIKKINIYWLTYMGESGRKIDFKTDWINGGRDCFTSVESFTHP